VIVLDLFNNIKVKCPKRRVARVLIESSFSTSTATCPKSFQNPHYQAPPVKLPKFNDLSASMFVLGLMFILSISGGIKFMQFQKESEIMIDVNAGIEKVSISSLFKEG
jgi:hypothetical protein